MSETAMIRLLGEDKALVGEENVIVKQNAYLSIQNQ
jgi:hypothetical protein